MNTHNDWQHLLELANDDLDHIGYSILITEPEKGFYDCEIWKDGELEETYAENYYENELSDLVTEVWHYINYIKNAE